MLKGILLTSVFSAALLTISTANAEPQAEPSLDNMMKMSITDLMDQKVTSVSKREEKASQAASAIHVITQDDIKRSGATKLTDLFRMVPGLNVAELQGHSTAVGVRGMADEFTNKLLVLIDGRSVYTPLFSGVYWDLQNPMLEDIERIEVIRGPGGTLWGANAVNGVINIITKKAQYTQGTYLSVGAGNEERGFAQARYGGKIGNNGYYRTYAQHSNRDGSTGLAGNDNFDGWRSSQGGFRMDMENSDKANSYTLQGDVFYNREQWEFELPSLTSFPSIPGAEKEDASGANILGRWKHIMDNGAENTLQAYADTTYRDNYSLDQRVTTLDLDYQYSLDWTDRNQLVAGAGTRYTQYQLENSSVISYPMTKADEMLYSSFVQNRYAVVPDKFFVTLGSKFELNDHTHFEIQPSARFSWLPAEKQTIWGSISRAVRTPSISEDSITLVNQATLLSGGIPGLIQVKGNSRTKSEELIAYELGYRVQPYDTVSFDLSTFYNDYSKLVTGNQGAITPTPFGAIVDLDVANDAKGTGKGFELSANWDVTSNWSIAAAYSYLDLNIKSESVNVLTTNDSPYKSPENQFNIRSRLDLPNRVQLDNMLYYVDEILGVQDYVRFDTRVSWRPMDAMELILVGQNLLDNHHQEFPATVYSPNSQVDRSVYAQAKLHF